MCSKCSLNTADRRFEIFDDEIKIRYFDEPTNNAIQFAHQHSKYEIYFAPTAVQGSVRVNSWSPAATLQRTGRGRLKEWGPMWRTPKLDPCNQRKGGGRVDFDEAPALRVLLAP